MDTNKQPGINFGGIILVKEEFERDTSIGSELETNVGFGISANESDGTYFVELETTIKLMEDGVNKVSLIFKHVGMFSVDGDSANLPMDDFLKYNAPAIMFPFVREHVSSITTKAGIPTVLLPPMNIVAMINQSPKPIDQAKEFSE